MENILIFFLLMCILFKQESWESISFGVGRFSFWKHILFKIWILILTESNSWNILSEITWKKNWLDFWYDFSLQILSYCLCILNQNSLLQLLWDLSKGCFVPCNLLCSNVYICSLLSLWILSLLHFFVCSLNFGLPFTPK